MSDNVLDWELQLKAREAAIELNYPIERAVELCEDFAKRHDLQFVRDGECGFGRPCSGFARDDRWIEYDPTNMTTYDRIMDSGDVHAPDGVEAYHKNNYLCVLKTKCDTNLPKFIAAISGAGQEKVDEMPEAVIPEESTNRAISQLACWIDTIERKNEVSIVRFESGAKGLQLMFDGSRFGHAIVATPR